MDISEQSAWPKGAITKIRTQLHRILNEKLEGVCCVTDDKKLLFRIKSTQKI